MADIKTIGVISTGVIGSSWIALFLARGYKVLVASPSIGAEERLPKYLEKVWPVLESAGLSPGASKANYQFVGITLKGYYDQCDFIQENAPGRIDIKRQIFAEADASTRKDV